MKEKLKQYILTWQNRCYSGGIPDEVPQEIFDQVPSYKRICIAIMKNDVTLESLGFTRTPCMIYKILKRKEIEERDTYPKQLKLF